MTVNVYAWPPVHSIAQMWTEDHPVQVSRSMPDGAEYRSAFGRSRRRAQLTVSALSGDRSAAGYIEVLKGLVAGVHAVRLTLPGPIWHLDAARLRALRQADPVNWLVPPGAVTWDVDWWSGRVVVASTGTATGAPVLVASGLPAGIIVARPGEQITVYAADKVTPAATAVVKAVARSDGTGVAVIPILSAVGPYTDRRINIGTDRSAVFRVDDWPDSPQPLGQNWTWGFSFREVFSDEVGGFVEIDPWASFGVADLDP